MKTPRAMTDHYVTVGNISHKQEPPDVFETSILSELGSNLCHFSVISAQLLQCTNSPSMLREVRPLPLRLRSKRGAGRSISDFFVSQWVRPEYLNFEPNRGNSPVFCVGSGVINLEVHSLLNSSNSTFQLAQLFRRIHYVNHSSSSFDLPEECVMFY